MHDVCGCLSRLCLVRMCSTHASLNSPSKTIATDTLLLQTSETNKTTTIPNHQPFHSKVSILPYTRSTERHRKQPFLPQNTWETCKDPWNIHRNHDINHDKELKPVVSPRKPIPKERDKHQKNTKNKDEQTKYFLPPLRMSGSSFAPKISFCWAFAAALVWRKDLPLGTLHDFSP